MLAAARDGGIELLEMRHQLLYECRCAAASLFDVPEPDSVVFTLNATHAHYRDAMTKLAGKGGAISFALQLKEKGSKTSKNILLETKDDNLVEFKERISNDE